MSASSTASNASPAEDSIKSVLIPICGNLLAAGTLAAFGSALCLVPLAVIAHIARTALEGTPQSLWQGWLLGIASLLLGAVLLLVGELVAHLADNRLTFGLRKAAAQRLAQVPLGWFTERTSGDVKQALQDDMATLHSLTAHFYTAVGRAAGAVVASAVYLLVQDWRMALLVMLPFAGFFVFLQRAMKASGANMQSFVERLGRINSATAAFAGGIPVMKTFGTGGQTHQAYREAVDGFAQAFTDFTRPLVVSMARAHALIAPVTVLGVVLACGLVFVALGWSAPVDVLPFALVAPGACAPVLL